MKISCLKEDLAHCLSVVNHAVATRATMPITQNVLLSAKESKLKLSATNLEIFITTWAGAAIQEEGEITVPARLLTELVNSLPNEQIDMDLPEGSGLQQLTCARAKAHINGVDAKEFPPIPDVDEGMTVLMDPQALRTAISRTAFAAAAEDSRPVLTGVEMKLSGSKFTMAAADGFRLAVHRGELAAEVESEATAIIPARTLTHLHHLLGNQEEPVEIAITTAKRHAMFRMQNTQMVLAALHGGMGLREAHDEMFSNTPEFSAMRDRVNISARSDWAGFEDRFYVGVTVITKDGRKLSKESKDRQMTEAELDAKFSYLVGLRAGEDKVRELAQVLKRMDTVSNVAEVMVQLELPEAHIDEVRR